MRQLLALLLMITPAVAADLPLPEAKPLSFRVERPRVNVAKPTKATLRQGSDTMVIACARECKATRTIAGNSQTISLGPGGAANFKKHIKAAEAYGWK